MSDQRPDTPPTLRPEKARQGRRGWQVLLVLVSGLALAMIAWAFVEIYGWTISPHPSEQVGDPSTVGGISSGDAPAPGSE